MFQDENGNSDFAEAYRGRRVCLFTTRRNIEADVNGFLTVGTTRELGGQLVC
jgi:hypothetical protein